MAGVPPPPPGFTLDAPTAGAAGVPPPPPGFKLDNAPNPNPPPQEKSVSGVKDTSVALSDDPNKEYGEILPFAIDKTTGKRELAFPEMVRAPVAASDRLLQGVRGQRPQEMGLNGLPGSQGMQDMLTVGGAAAGPGVIKAASREAPAVADIAKTALTKPVTPAETAAFDALKQGRPLAPKPVDPALPQVVNSADDMKKVASHYYQQATEQGGTLAPHYVDQIIDKIEAPLVRPEKIGKIAGEDDATTLAKSIREHAGGKPMTLEEAQALDEHIGDLVDKHFTVKGLDKVGKRIVDMQSGLRDSISGADETHLVGGANGFEALKNGRKAWSQAAKMRDIESIVDGAQYADQPTTWVRNRIRTILTNKTKRRGFSDAEIAELEKVAKTGKVEGMLKAFGGRLTPYMAEAVGGSVGGIPGFLAGAAIGHGGSTLARNAATGLQGRKVNDLMNMLGQGAPPDSGEILRVLGQQNAP